MGRLTGVTGGESSACILPAWREHMSRRKQRYLSALQHAR
jgi:hypothetical protein